MTLQLNEEQRACGKALRRYSRELLAFAATAGELRFLNPAALTARAPPSLKAAREAMSDIEVAIVDLASLGDPMPKVAADTGATVDQASVWFLSGLDKLANHYRRVDAA